MSTARTKRVLSLNTKTENPKAIQKTDDKPMKPTTIKPIPKPKKVQNEKKSTSNTPVILQSTTTIIPIQTTQPIQPTQDTSSIWDSMFAQMHEPIQNMISEIPVIHVPERIDNLDESASTKIPLKEYLDLDMEYTTIISSKKSNECPSCKSKLTHNGNKLECGSCGLVIDDSSGMTDEQYTTPSLSDCNVSDKGFMSMKIVGKGAYGNNRSLLKSCAKYDQYRNMTTRKDVHNWNSQSTDKHLPKNVIEEACNMFAKIKAKGYVYRKDVKKGVLSACIYYACYNNGISKTPNEIASLVGIAEKFHSMGDRILRDLNERGVVELPDKIDPVVDYVLRYMEVLGIDKKYKDFVLDIIHVADREKLHVLSDSKNNTKCIGAIYLLIDRVPDLRKTIDKDKIDNDCEISKTTFIKYYNLICKFYRKFVPVFVRHSIPMKIEWKEDISEVIKNKTPEIQPEPTRRKKYTKKSDATKAKPPTKLPPKRQKKNVVPGTPDVVENKVEKVEKVNKTEKYEESIKHTEKKVENKVTDHTEKVEKYTEKYEEPIKRVAKLPAKYIKKTNISAKTVKHISVDITSPKSDTTDTSHDEPIITIKKKINAVRKSLRV